MRQAIKHTQHSYETIRRACHTGELEHGGGYGRAYRFKHSDLDNWLKHRGDRP